MLRYSDHQIGQGPAVLRQACRFGLEGIVAKRRDAPYRAGRSASWLKLKCGNRAEFVVVGFTDPAASREGFGALLLGCHDPQARPALCRPRRYRLQHGAIAGLASAARCPARRDPAAALPQAVPLKGVHWVEPRLVAEISFAGWTADALLRQASFQGLREDKDAAEVVCEAVSPTKCEPRYARPEAGRPATASSDALFARPRRQPRIRRGTPDSSRPHPLSRPGVDQARSGALLRGGRRLGLAASRPSAVDAGAHSGGPGQEKLLSEACRRRHAESHRRRRHRRPGKRCTRPGRRGSRRARRPGADERARNPPVGRRGRQYRDARPGHLRPRPRCRPRLGSG